MCKKVICLVFFMLASGIAHGWEWDRAAYWDARYPTGWAAEPGPTTVRDALELAGYTILDADQLKTWMLGHIADGEQSVVVMCKDIVPDTVAETMTANCTFRQYLDAGGKVVWFSDWPIYYQGLSDGTSFEPTWGGAGAINVLGFEASGGPNDSDETVAITEAGAAWGLTQTWGSLRPTPITITPNLTPLATVSGGASAAAWAKHYLPGDTYRGFVRTFDRTGTPTALIDDIIRLAEYADMGAKNPTPANGSAVAPTVYPPNVYMMLDYTPGRGAVSHTGYFSDNIDDVISRDPAHCLNQPPWPDMDEEAFIVGYDDDAIEEFARAPLVFGETYYWCVDVWDGEQTWPGAVWSFLAMGEKAWGPTPADGDIFIPSGPDLTLIWNLGDLDMDGYLNKVTYKVYFGTDETDLPLLEAPEPNTCVVPGTALDPDTTYYWRVDEIRRENSVPFPAVATEGDVWSFTTGPAGLGSILYEYWLDIGGTALSALRNDPRYPESPDGSDSYPLFESPTDWADNYGARMHGWLYVRNTGDYTFWIATDDYGELWLSSDANPDNVTLISYVNGWAPARAWDDVDVTPSGPIHLVRGERYYISGLIKEGGGGDNIAVAWQGPDSGGARVVIPGGSLMGYVPLKAYNPNPANGDANVALNTMLSWTPGTEESTGDPYTIQHVYVGSDATAVANATTGSDEYMGVVGPNQYGPLSLSYYEQVYWRVDSEDSDTGVIYPSPVWTFKAAYNPALIVDENLVGWWQLDDGSGTFVADSSGYGNDGATNGGPIWVEGYDDGALALDGVDDFVEIPHNTGLTVDNEVTVMAWIKAGRYTGGPGASDWQAIITKSNSPRSYSLYTYVDGSLHFSTAGVGSNSSMIVPLNEWTHVAAMVVGGMHMYYINGIAAGQGGTGIILPGAADDDSVLIGDSHEADREFLGLIDDVRIYNRSLSQEEITKIMRGNMAWAWNPNPDNGATGVARTPILTWTPGDYATSHYVFFGTDEDALPQVAGPQPTASYNPGLLDLGTTHYWAIGEANAAAPPDYMDRGRTWRFTTINYLVIDNMDAYVAYDVPAGPHIFVAWRDGKGDCAGSGNETGANLLETTPVFASSQLMRYDWDNDGLVLNPCTGAADDPRPYYYSKIVAQVAGLPSGIGSNWTIGGVKALSLLFYGDTLNSINDPLWVQLSDSSGPGIKVEYGTYADESLGDIQDPGWQEWLIDLNDFDVELTDVRSIAIGIGDENATGPHISSGTLYIDDVRLYTPRCVPSRNTGGFADADYAPVGAPDCVVNYKELKIMGQDWAQFDYNVYSTPPASPNLVASYQFENNANDGSPNGNHGTEQGGPIYAISRPGMGMAINCDGVDDYVSTGKSAADLGIEGNNPRTVTAWVYIRAFNNGAIFDVGNRANGEEFSLRTMGTDNSWRIQYWGGNVNETGWSTGDFDFTYPSLNEWVHFGHVHDGTYTKIYANGELIVNVPRTINTSSANPFQIAMYGWPDFYLDALIDDFRLYDYGLSHGEVRGVLGLPTLYVPVSSPANISDDEPATEKKVNFKDYAELMDFWGMEQEWPTW